MLSLKRIRIITAATLSCCLVTFSLAADSLPSHAQSATQMTVAVNAFIATLDENQRETVVQPLLIDERTTWSNLPISMVLPDGVLAGNMTDDQRTALHDLLRASMSSQGYAKAAGIMRLDDLLYDIESERFADNPRRMALVQTGMPARVARKTFNLAHRIHQQKDLVKARQHAKDENAQDEPV